MLRLMTSESRNNQKSASDEQFRDFQMRCSQINGKYANGNFENTVLPPWIKYPKCNMFNQMEIHEESKDYIKNTFLPFWRSMSNFDKVKYLMRYHVDTQYIHVWFKILS